MHVQNTLGDGKVTNKTKSCNHDLKRVNNCNFSCNDAFLTFCNYKFVSIAFYHNIKDHNETMTAIIIYNLACNVTMSFIYKPCTYVGTYIQHLNLHKGKERKEGRTCKPRRTHRASRCKGARKSRRVRRVEVIKKKQGRKGSPEDPD